MSKPPIKGALALIACGIAVRSLLVTASLSLLSSGCFALGLGDIKHSSYLGETLEARINLINIPTELSAENLRLRHLSDDEAQALGVDIVARWNRLEFDVDTSRDTYQITVASRKPIREPFLNILLELEWPKGKLYKEYTIFFDPAPLSRQADKISKHDRVGNPSTTKVSKRATKSSHGNVDKTYTVAPGDTLSSIAKRTNTQARGAESRWAEQIFNNNPHAFINNNRHLLLAGVDLQLPKALAPGSARPEPHKGRLTLVAQTPEQVHANPVKARVHANQLQIDKLVAENRDLKDRLYTLENAQAFSALSATLEAQRELIADLQQALNTGKTTQNAPQQAPEEASSRVNTYAAASMGPLTGYSEKNEKYWALLISAGLLMLLIGYSLARIFAARLSAANSHASRHIDVKPNLAKSYPMKTAMDEIDEVLLEIKQQEILNMQRRNTPNKQVQAKAEATQLHDENIHQQIKQKVENYQQTKEQGSKHATAVLEEIDIDPELEDYLKI
ncbi:LysM domain-containing protein [Alteromonadaceae bacterium Bs31]|nr:LysM domain-containing protein [Alteromonadaceae bacterium Bs31]